MRTIYFLFAVLVMLAPSCRSKNSNTNQGSGSPDSVRIVNQKLNYPWEILWGKDDFIWMTERGGKISKLDTKTGSIVFSYTLNDVVSNNEGGLLGMVQHPDFLNNGLFYVVYDYNNGAGYFEKLVQLKFSDNNVQTLTTVINNIPASSIHNGSRLWISNDASPKIFMSTGDAAVQNNAQQTTSLSGKILRFNLDGSIPADNPIAGSPVWSFGHRNIQGLVAGNGILYASEHGPTEEDEINIIERNRNYGWPNVTGPCNTAAENSFCAANNIKEPLWSSGNQTIAVCGMDYYNNDRIAAFKNCLLLTTLKDASLRILKLSADGKTVGGQQAAFKHKFGRIRDICISPAGTVYLCTSNGGNEDILAEILKF